MKGWGHDAAAGCQHRQLGGEEAVGRVRIADLRDMDRLTSRRTLQKSGQTSEHGIGTDQDRVTRCGACQLPCLLAAANRSGNREETACDDQDGRESRREP